MGSRDRGLGRTILLASEQGLFDTSLRAVLEPEGFLFCAGDRPEVVGEALRDEPLDLIIVDEAMAVSSETVREAIARERSVPVLLYARGHWGTVRSIAQAVGAWDVVEEPVRATELRGRLERLLGLSALLAHPSPGRDGLDERAGVSWLLAVTPMLASISTRTGTSMGCAVLGPTRSAPAGEDAERVRRRRTIVSQTRESDLCVWVGEDELALVLPGTDVEGAGECVRRIAGLESGSRVEERSLSAGLTVIEPPGHPGGLGAPMSRVATNPWILGHVHAALRALERARAAGGGVRVAVTE